MTDNQLSINEEFLKEFVDTPSPSGSEEPAQRLFRAYVQDYVDEIRTDVLGNVIAVVNPTGSPKIMLAGHVDEVGLQVRYITEKGFIYFNQLGGLDSHLLPGCRVKILTDKGDVIGIIGKKAIHLQKPDERKKVIKSKEQYIDIGARSREEVEKLGIRIGDPMIFDFYYEKMGNKGDVVCRCFDDKIGGFIVAEILRQLKGEQFEAAVYGVSTTQEEVGLRGATVSAFDIDPQIGIAYDVDFATDTPSVDEKEVGICKLGDGPLIARGPNLTPKLYDLIIKTAEEIKIPMQIRSEPRGTGTDANILQMTRSGMATALIGIPNRYMHSMSEVVNLNDVDAIVKLSIAVIKKISKTTSFIPN
ncbi:MAG: M42 family metallopeptidase [Promethearchaeota archaeon]